MIRVVLFDLDGTLLGMDDARFSACYFSSLYRECFDRTKFSFDEAISAVMDSVKIASSNDASDRTAYEKFYGAFEKKVPGELEVYRQKFERYYETAAYDECRKSVSFRPEMAEAVRELKKKGYLLAVATNPLFPRLAIEKRFRWAGLNSEDFEFITFSEDFHFMKPNLGYYKEILSRFPEVSPSEVMMVGNDVEEDMIASRLGCDVYLVKDYLISRRKKEDEIEHRGTGEEFLRYVKENM